MVRGFLKRFRSGMPVRDVCDVRNLNRIANILEDLEGYGGIRIEKPSDGDGNGWRIILDLSPSASGFFGFPWGKEHPFGLVGIDGTAVELARADYLEGERGYASWESAKLPAATNDNADDDGFVWIGVQYNPEAAGSPEDPRLSVVGPQKEKPAPHDGLFVCWLYRFKFVEGDPNAEPVVPDSISLDSHNLTGWQASIYAQASA